MNTITNYSAATEWPLTNRGCASCWAAGYCAAFAPTSLITPPACPLSAQAGSDSGLPRRGASKQL
ncbi:hypothetical protein [Hymenobacter sp. BRD67]|uniref:hypothetical protein n=1 Tax=Hymenobacter sp. BRD67 TaxID=2675877 RepID=UPI0015630BF1|nr:hypothetical protein [Hymenobacter sp. BRD67]QKG51728.1 hypothetical protein GKZ67_02870 [Hymenobacter sp. BRD67]